MRYFFNSAAPSAISTHLADHLHVMGYGQSLSMGLLANPPVTTVQPYDNLMFNTGVRSKFYEGGDYTSLVPLVETTLASPGAGETGIAAAGNLFVEKMAPFAAHPDQGFAVLGSTAGRSGHALIHLEKGTTAYTNLIEMVQAGYNLSLADGKSYAFHSLAITHGEADQQGNTPRRNYRDGMLTLISDIAVDVAVVSGQAWRPITVLNQVASHLTYYNSTGGTSSPRPEIALAQRDVAAMSSDAFVALPHYILDYIDAGVHLTARSSEMFGKYFGRALAAVTLARMTGEPDPAVAVDLKSAVWQGSVIDLEFSVPHAPLAFDTTWVSDTWNKGFDLWQADGLTLQDIIDDVSIAGPNRVRIQTSTEPAAGSRLTYGFGRTSLITAGRTAGPRGNLRDSAGDIDTYNDGTGTRRLDNWCLIFETRKP